MPANGRWDLIRRLKANDVSTLLAFMLVPPAVPVAGCLFSDLKYPNCSLSLSTKASLPSHVSSGFGLIALLLFVLVETSAFTEINKSERECEPTQSNLDAK